MSCHIHRLPEASSECEDDTDTVEHRHRVPEIQSTETHQQHLFHVRSDAQGECRCHLMDDE